EQTIRRLVAQALVCAVFTFLVCVGTALLIFHFGLITTDPFANIKQNFLGGLLISYLIIAISEGAEFYQGWKTNLVRAETLAKEKAEVQLALVDAQLSALKDQLNPHFLFNSLNTLSSLIDLKNEKAITYLEQLADVYRYVLEHQDKHLVSLEQELTFAQAYIALNKTRFRNDLTYSVTLRHTTPDTQLPPYALQLLLENAIKHNAIAPDKPLKITVADTPDYLVVSNNKQPKLVVASSIGMGLDNLRHRSELATGRPIQIIETDNEFTVQVPFVNYGSTERESGTLTVKKTAHANRHY
ncbi:MAG: histidine kinase, partial [Bacteroidota bacterium]